MGHDLEDTTSQHLDLKANNLALELKNSKAWVGRTNFVLMEHFDWLTKSKTQ